LKTTQTYGEYGCGASTKWALQNTNAKIRAVDTSQQWVEEVLSNINSETSVRLTIKHVDLGEVGGWGRPLS
jgi:hydroxymethylpyrimidine/phosphomethylpyrimidine kinase